MAKLTMPNAENCSLAELNVAAQAAPTKQSHIRLTSGWLLNLNGLLTSFNQQTCSIRNYF